MIDIETWDKATWRGAGFLFSQDPMDMPILLLIYKNEKYASVWNKTEKLKKRK